MGLHREEQMLREMDASARVYFDGSDLAELVFRFQLNEVFQADNTDVLLPHLSEEKIIALRGVSQIIGDVISFHQNRPEVYGSDNHSVAAGVFIADQNSYEGIIDRGFASGSDYEFDRKLRRDGLLGVFQGEPSSGVVSDQWISRRLDDLGVLADDDLCGLVVHNLLDSFQFERSDRNG